MQIRLHDATISCEVIGSGRPIVFLHGFPLNGLMWLHAAHRLPAGYKALVPDLRGHGLSTATGETSIGSLADDAISLLDLLDPVQPAVFVGLSMGGIVCFEVWRRYRHRVRALVLCNTRSGADTPQAADRRRWLASEALRAGPAAIVDTMVPSLFGPTFNADQREHWRKIMLRTPALGLAATSRALADRTDSTAMLGTITCPALVVASDQDTITPVDSLRNIHSAIAGSDFEIIPGAGHVPPIEQPELFSATLNRFLASLCERRVRQFTNVAGLAACR